MGFPRRTRIPLSEWIVRLKTMITCQGYSQKAFFYEWEVGLEGRQTLW